MEKKKKKVLAGLRWTRLESETKMGSLIGKWVAALADVLFPAGVLCSSSFVSSIHYVSVTYWHPKAAYQTILKVKSG